MELPSGRFLAAKKTWPIWMDTIRLSGAQTQMTKQQKATESGTPAYPQQTLDTDVAPSTESSGGEINATKQGVSGAFESSNLKSNTATASGAGF